MPIIPPDSSFTIPYNPDIGVKLPMSDGTLYTKQVFPNQTGGFSLVTNLDISNTTGNGFVELTEGFGSIVGGLYFSGGRIWDFSNKNFIGSYNSNQNIEFQIQGDSQNITYSINKKEVGQISKSGLSSPSSIRASFTNCTGNIKSLYSGYRPTVTLSTAWDDVGKTGLFAVHNHEVDGTLHINSVYLSSGSGLSIGTISPVVLAGGSGQVQIISQDEIFAKDFYIYVDTNGGLYRFSGQFNNSYTGEWGSHYLVLEDNIITNSGELYATWVNNVNTGVLLKSIELVKSGSTGQYDQEMYVSVLGTGVASGKISQTDLYGLQQVTIPFVTGNAVDGGIPGNFLLELGTFISTGITHTIIPTGFVSKTGIFARASSVVNDYEYYPKHPSGEPQFILQSSTWSPNCSPHGYCIVLSEDNPNPLDISPSVKKLYYLTTGEWAQAWATDGSGISIYGNTGIVNFTRDSLANLGGGDNGSFTGYTGSPYHTMTQFIMWLETGGDGFAHPTGGVWYFESQSAVFNTGCLYPALDTLLRDSSWYKKSSPISSYDDYREAVDFLYPRAYSLNCGAFNRDGDSGVYGQLTETTVQKTTYYTNLSYTVTGTALLSHSGSFPYDQIVTGIPTTTYAQDDFRNILPVNNRVFSGRVSGSIPALWDTNDLITGIYFYKDILIPEGIKTFSGLYNLYTGANTGDMLNFKDSGWFSATGFSNEFVPNKEFPRYTGLELKVTYYNPFTTGTLQNGGLLQSGDGAMLRVNYFNNGVIESKDYPIFGVKV